VLKVVGIVIIVGSVVGGVVGPSGVAFFFLRCFFVNRNE
jgi:hypothetical protein